MLFCLELFAIVSRVARSAQVVANFRDREEACGSAKVKGKLAYKVTLYLTLQHDDAMELLRAIVIAADVISERLVSCVYNDYNQSAPRRSGRPVLSIR